MDSKSGTCAPIGIKSELPLYTATACSLWLFLDSTICMFDESMLGCSLDRASSLPIWLDFEMLLSSGPSGIDGSADLCSLAPQSSNTLVFATTSAVLGGASISELSPEFDWAPRFDCGIVDSATSP
jgi:hypothetical protein